MAFIVLKLFKKSLDDVVCGVCGICPEICLGDRNEKSCCSNSQVCGSVCIIIIILVFLLCCGTYIMFLLIYVHFSK